MRLRRALSLLQVVLIPVIGATMLVNCAPPPTPTPIPTATPLPSATPTSTPVPTPTSTPTPQPPALTMWHNLPAKELTFLEREIARFQETYHKVRIVPVRYDDESALEQALADRDRDPGIVLGNAHVLGLMRDRQLVQPVEALFESALFQDLARSGTEGIMSGGHLWGIPHTLGMQLLLFYNTQLVSEPPADTESMIQMASNLTNADRFGLGMNALDPLWLIPWLAAYGGWPVDDQGGLTLNTDAMVSALTFMRDLTWKHEIMSATSEYDTGLEAFTGGQSAMWIDGEWALGPLGNADDLQPGVALLPILADTGLEPACLIAGKYFSVGAGVEGDQLEAAQLFIEQMVMPEGAARWTEMFHTLPSSLTVLESALIQDDPFLRVSAAQMLAGRSIGLSDGMQTAMEIMRGPLEDVMNRRISPKEAARGMQARADALESS